MCQSWRRPAGCYIFRLTYSSEDIITSISLIRSKQLPIEKALELDDRNAIFHAIVGAILLHMHRHTHTSFRIFIPVMADPRNKTGYQYPWGMETSIRDERYPYERNGK
jgi:hypothetical protein